MTIVKSMNKKRKNTDFGYSIVTTLQK